MECCKRMQPIRVQYFRAMTNKRACSMAGMQCRDAPQLLPWYRGMLNQRAAPLSPCGLTETWHKYQHSENISFKSRNITKASLALTSRPTDAFLFIAEGFCGSEIFPRDPKLGCKSVYWCSKARLRYHHPRPRRGHLVVPFTASPHRHQPYLGSQRNWKCFSCFLI